MIQIQKPILEFEKVGLLVPEFSLQGKECYARVVDIYDGDTLTIILPFNDSYHRFAVRLLGIDTPEMKSKLVDNKKKAIRARNTVMQWVLPNKIINLEEPYTRKQIQEMLASEVSLIWVKCDIFEKYGRLMIEAFSDFQSPASESFSKRLIREGLAYEYFGGTKLTEQDQQQTAA